jgi:PIN domain nuclease of toxin-antitoxin system
LDTHPLIWWLEENPKLSIEAYNTVKNPENQIFISTASIWEIRIKQSISRLDLYDQFDQDLLSQPFEILNITIHHANAIGKLEIHHNDPFDRMLIVQAQIEELILITRDHAIQQYQVDVLLA